MYFVGFLVTRKPDFGGDSLYATYEELESAFAAEVNSVKLVYSLNLSYELFKVCRSR